MCIVARSSGFFLVFAMCVTSHICQAQELTPRAYVVTPVHSSAIILTYSFDNGSILFDPTLPITNSTGKLNIAIFSYYHAFNLFGRSANITASLPYAVGHFEGNVNGAQQGIYRSGLMDSVFRLAVNIKGGPAMSLQDFLLWRQKMILGASLKIVAPTGQYDATKLVTPRTNRWAFKPEWVSLDAGATGSLTRMEEPGSSRRTPSLFHITSYLPAPTRFSSRQWVQ